jgi:hypothetical protein
MQDVPHAPATARVPSLQDWQWWIKNPAVALVGLYVCGFVAQNTYLSGFRFISTDLLDKNYVIVGLLCFAVLAVTYFFVFSPIATPPEFSDRLNDASPLREVIERRFLDAFVWVMVYVFNFAAAASVLGSLTIHGNASGVLAIWALVALIEQYFNHQIWKFVVVLLARFSGFAVFMQFYLHSHGSEFVIALAAGFVIWSVRTVFDRNYDPAFTLGQSIIRGILVVLTFSAAYGKFFHELVVYEFGGGEPKKFIIRYQDEQSSGPREQNYVTVEAPMVYASDSIVYIRREDAIQFVRREKIVSIEPSPTSRRR